MAKIQVLDDKTIDQIAAGEVVERPASVVKELVENACDAGADAITVEIREGGLRFIRVTDNGSGIEASQVKSAFYRHATSKIRDISDLSRLHSMGFRGEALSSIAAVSMVEIITKTKEALTGIRYCLEGEKETEFSEVGAPDGTTVIVRNLFFNTPARRKFLRSAATEGSEIVDLMEHLAMARPDISFQLILNRQPRFATSGSNDLQEVVFRIYGRQIAKEIFPFSASQDGLSVEGFLGTPLLVRPNRNFEFFFVNRRSIKSRVLSKGLESGYAARLMQHKFPVACLHLTMDAAEVDVNVHPAKTEVRFLDNQKVMRFLEQKIKEALLQREMIPQITLSETPALTPPKPEENQAQEQERKPKAEERPHLQRQEAALPQPFEKNRFSQAVSDQRLEYQAQKTKDGQLNLFEEKILTQNAVQRYELIGQIFDTYWIAVYQDKMILIDQHAAHEKVKYEALVAQLKTGGVTSQNLMPPMIVTLSGREEEILKRYLTYFSQIGFEIEPFGGNSYAVYAAPCELYGNCSEAFLQSLLNDLSAEQVPDVPEAVTRRLAMLACKSAVKGGKRMDQREMQALLEQLLELENPYQCPHGRPTMITMSRQELERRFKRIV